MVEIKKGKPRHCHLDPCERCEELEAWVREAIEKFKAIKKDKHLKHCARDIGQGCTCWEEIAINILSKADELGLK